MFETEDAFETHEEFEKAAEFILQLAGFEERGEITAEYLFQMWAKFRRKADKYLEKLRKETESNKNLS